MCVRFPKHNWILVGLLAGGITVALSLDAQSTRQTIALPKTQGMATPAERLSALRRRALLAATSAKAQRIGIAAHLQPMVGSQTAGWQPVGPMQVGTANYGLVTGRITSIALDPSDATGNRVFAGTNAGGVWGSTNAASGAAVFTPLTDTPAALAGDAEASISIGAVSVQPGGTGVILAGTGDTNNAPDSYLGTGILRSTDNGATWQLISESSDAEYGPYSNHSFLGLGFSGFAWSTTNPQFVVAALASSTEASLVNGVQSSASVMGIYYSSDAGATWQLATIQDSAGQEIEGPDMDFSGWTGNAVTAVVWNPIRKAFFAAVQYHGYYESTDGVTWTRLSSQPGSGLTTSNCPKNYGSIGSSACPIFRGALAVQPVTGDLFALTVNLTNEDQGLWQDKCALTSGKCASNTVSFAQKISTTALDQAGVIASGGFNLVLAAAPTQQDTLLYVGETDLWRCSIAASCAWRNTTNATTCFSGGVAPAQHAIAWDATSPTLMYFGNEGGLWRSSDGVAETGSVCAATDASHFTNLNGSLGSLAMVVNFAQSPTTAGFYLAGLNELGSIAGNSSIWSQVLTGEAGPVAMDANTSSLWYTESGPGIGIHQCTAGTLCYASGFGATAVIGAAQTESDGISMSAPAPFLLDPADTTEVLVGSCRVWRGKASGAGWSASNAISPMLDGITESSCNGNAWIRSLAAAPAAIPNTEYYYVGMAGVSDGGGTVAGHIIRGWWTGSSATWTDIAKNPVTNDTNGFNPAGFAVSSLYADPSDASGQTLYATIEGFSGNGSYVPLVYQTKNGGASWLNLSSNLPDTPATAVVVDPLDPNTVYIALLNGVYSTRAISSCAVQGENCWTLMGTGLPYAPVTSLSARALGGSYTLTAATYGRGLWSVPLLSTPASVTTMSVSPASLGFPNVATGQASAALPITITNTGSIPLVVASVAVTGAFSETDNCQGVSVAVGAGCTIEVIFSPTATGALTGTLALTANISGGPVTVALSGTGVLPAALSVLPGSLSFGSIVVGQSAAVQNLTVANTGGASLALSAISMSGSGFLLTSNSCGATLAAQSSCTLSVVFTPTASGAASGLATITSSAATATIPLAGTGANPATDTLSTASLSFGSVVVGSVSAAQSVTVTNSGDLSLNLISVATSGDFQTTNNCGATLAAHSSCSLAVSFSPTTTSAESGVLTLTDANGSKTIALSGTGLAPAVFAAQPTQLVFAATQVGLTGAVLTVTVTNTGGVALLNPTAAIVGDFSLQSTTCGAMIAAGGNCVYALSFTPTVVGQRAGSLTLTSLSVASPLVVSLSGTGLAPAAFAVTPAQLNFSATQVGLSSAVLSETVTNSGGVSLLNPTATIAGDFVQQSTTCGAAIAAGASCTITILFTPTAAGIRTGTLTLTSSSVTGSSVISLSGVGLAPAAFAVSPAQLSFAATQVGLLTAALSLTVTNSGGVVLLNPAATVEGDFSITANTCGATIAAGVNCTITILFSPTATGIRTGTLTLSSPSGTTLTVPLSGVGLAPASFAAAPAQLNFAATQVGLTSAAMTVTVTNAGGVDLLNPTAVVSGDFSIAANTCGATIAAAGYCTITIQFLPAIAGNRTGTLTLSSTSVSSALLIPLSSVGLVPASFAAAPAQLSFAATQVGVTISAMMVTVTNSGGVALLNPSAAISGDFSIASNTCGATIAAGANCTIAILFTPSAAGSRTGTLTLTSASVASPLPVPLAGTGLAPAAISLTPTQLSFAATPIGETSAAQSITVTDSGGVALQNPAATVSGDFVLQSSTCGATLAAGAGCTIAIAFSPTLAGARSGSVTLSGAGVASAMIALSGNGLTAASLSTAPQSLSFAAQPIGATESAQTVTITNNGGAALTGLVLAASGDFAITNNSCGSMLAGGSSCSVAVSFTPTASGIRSGGLSIAPTAVVVPLSGVGLTAAALNASPQNLSFSATVIGSASSAQVVTLTNTGGATLTGLSLAISGDFAILSTTCGTALAGGASCTAAINFSPTVIGNSSGTLAANSATTAAVVTLTGAGLTPASLTLTPQTLAFSSILIGSTTAAQTVTATNTGGASLSGMTLSITGDYVINSSTCGSTLAGGASCTVAVSFTPTQSGSRAGTLSIASAASTQQTALSGIGLTPAAVSITPQSLVFAAQQVGSSSGVQTLMISNTGGANLTGLSIVVSEEFAISGNNCGANLAGGASCNLSVSFTPSGAGIRSGSLSLLSIAPTVVVPLTGTGLTAASLTVAPLNLSFGTVQLGATSSTQIVTLTNPGGEPLSVLSLAVSGDYSLANNTCATTLAGGASCTVAVGFTPTAAGSRAGAINIGSSAGSAAVSLSGTGVAAASLSVSPLALDFGTVLLGATAAAQTITLTNSGGVAFQSLTLGITGDYAIASSTCGLAVAANSSCVVGVSFTPTLSGSRGGALTITGGSPAANFTITLSGAGILNGAFSLSTQSLSFGQIAVGSTSASQTVTITNSGGLALSGLVFTIATPYVLTANTCGTTLSAGAGCAVSIEYSPTVAGAASAALALAAATPVTSASIVLNGAGVDFTLAASGTNSAAILTGQTATYQLNLTPLGGMTGSFAFTCTGAPANATCVANPNPVSITGSNSATIGIAVATGLNAAAPIPGFFPAKPAVLSCLLLLGAVPLFAARKFRRSRLKALQLLAVLLLALLPVFGTGCGVSIKGGNTASGTAPGGNAGTPIGSYTLSVTATSGGITHSTTLQLVVN